MTRRISASILVLLAILVLPYWLYVPLLIIAFILFPLFWEGILLAILIDIVHGGALGGPGALFSSFGFYALLLSIILLPIRERLRYHV